MTEKWPKNDYRERPCWNATLLLANLDIQQPELTLIFRLDQSKGLESEIEKIEDGGSNTWPTQLSHLFKWSFVPCNLQLLLEEGVLNWKHSGLSILPVDRPQARCGLSADWGFDLYFRILKILIHLLWSSRSHVIIRVIQKKMLHNL